MNIQELRLGNAVSVKVWDDLNPLFTVTEIGYDVLWVSNSGGNVSTPVSPGLVAGIPISKDTVKNIRGLGEGLFGAFFFKVEDLELVIDIEDNEVILNLNMATEISESANLPDKIFTRSLPNITQIHQLQNLIYDLNGGVMLEYNTNAQ